VAVLGILKAKGLAPILAVLLCPCLLCDSPSELQKAQGLLAKGSLAEAVTVLRQIVQDDRGNPDAHLLLGTALALQGLRLESLKEIETAINLSPDSAYFLRAKVWSAQGDNDNAISDLEKATRLSADYADAWFDLSQLEHSREILIRYSRPLKRRSN
jgi:tetratricopeptide (TPR) repeat protein